MTGGGGGGGGGDDDDNALVGGMLFGVSGLDTHQPTTPFYREIRWLGAMPGRVQGRCLGFGLDAWQGL